MLRILRDLWLIFGVSLLLLLVVDGLLKAWLPERSWPTVVAGATAPDRARADALRDVDWVGDYFAELKAARHLDWHSYVYWRRQPFEGRHIRIDEQGLRAGWMPDTAPGRVIWMFGGSTVWGTGARDEYTLPSALARTLAERGLPTEVINFGESGYVSRQGLITLLDALASRPPPDLVVFVDGVNDVFAALQSGHAGRPQNEWRRAVEFRASDGLDDWLAVFPRVLEGIGRLIGSSAPPDDLETLAEAVAARYLANVAAARAVAEERGAQAMFFWQPSVFTRAEPSASEQQVIDASLAAHRDLQLAANQSVAARAQASGVVDLSARLDRLPEPLYLDFCHLSEAGNAYLAEAMADYMAPLLTSD